jgi:DNA-binding transcriptional MocR family regulator
VRTTLASNSQSAVDAIIRYFPTGTRVARPSGGIVLWIELPAGVDGAELFRTALASRIGIAPGLVFSAKADYRSYIRISCGMLWTATIERAIEKLGKLVAGMAQMDKVADRQVRMTKAG